ncbi:MAG: hypothetical protein M1281_16455 [Chloroflexi bacterium]|nr:hypothetical protein [Chloroflexota bacterium]
MTNLVEPRSFDDFEAQFQNHFSQKVEDKNARYGDYMPAYRLGYDLALNEILMSKPWEVVETEAHEYWEERRPGTWESFRGAVYFAWKQVKDSATEG